MTCKCVPRDPKVDLKAWTKEREKDYMKYFTPLSSLRPHSRTQDYLFSVEFAVDCYNSDKVINDLCVRGEQHELKFDSTRRIVKKNRDFFVKLVFYSANSNFNLFVTNDRYRAFRLSRFTANKGSTHYEFAKGVAYILKNLEKEDEKSMQQYKSSRVASYK